MSSGSCALGLACCRMRPWLRPWPGVAHAGPLWVRSFGAESRGRGALPGRVAGSYGCPGPSGYRQGHATRKWRGPSPGWGAPQHRDVRGFWLSSQGRPGGPRVSWRRVSARTYPAPAAHAAGGVRGTASPHPVDLGHRTHTHTHTQRQYHYLLGTSPKSR